MTDSPGASSRVFIAIRISRLREHIRQTSPCSTHTITRPWAGLGPHVCVDILQTMRLYLPLGCGVGERARDDPSGMCVDILPMTVDLVGVSVARQHLQPSVYPVSVPSVRSPIFSKKHTR